jgi:hypothetical protein
MGVILRPTVVEERFEEEGPTYHGIVRYTHVRCGFTTRVRGEMEILNDLDAACPRCSAYCREEDCRFEGCDGDGTCPIPYGTILWEQADGTIFETFSEDIGHGYEVTLHRQVCTHIHIYKSWVNGPEWWVRPEPTTGDMDDNLIVGFDTYQQALDALPNLRSTLDDCAAPAGIAWRDRHDPMYQLTPPKETRF